MKFLHKGSQYQYIYIYIYISIYLKLILNINIYNLLNNQNKIRSYIDEMQK